MRLVVSHRIKTTVAQLISTAWESVKDKLYGILL